jgi:hypothetical protein
MLLLQLRLPLLDVGAFLAVNLDRLAANLDGIVISSLSVLVNPKF